MNRHLPSRRRQRGVTVLETIVFVPVLMMFWIAFQHFGAQWQTTQLLHPVAGNAAYDVAIDGTAPGSVTLQTGRTATVTDQVSGDLEGLQFKFPVPWNELIDPTLANARGGRVDVEVRFQHQNDPGLPEYMREQPLHTSAVVLRPPLRPDEGVIGQTQKKYERKVIDFHHRDLQPFAW